MTIKDKLAQLEKAFESNGVRRIKLGAFDIDGILRGKYVSMDKFRSIAEGGLGFCDVIFGWDSADRLYDRPTVTGWHTGYPDTHAKIDLDSFRMIPWEEGTASFLLDLCNKDGSPLEVSPRQLLRTVIAKAESAGLSPTVAAEFEFFIYKEDPWSANEQGYVGLKPLTPGMFGYSWLRTSQAQALVHDLLESLEAYGIPLEGFHTETGPGVFEGAITYTSALEAADRAALFKTAVKEICHRHGVMASFMAKPSNALPGCSGHLHQSLWSAAGATNAFYDDAAPNKISALMKNYVAGQLTLMPEFLSLYAPNINSYKRLVPGTWAPNAAAWGIDNRTCALRAIPGSSKSTRVEVRVTGSDINPYIAIAASIAAGLYGLQLELPPPAPLQGNAYDLDDPSAMFPRTLRAAIGRLEQSEIAHQLLGETFVKHYIISRDFECRQAEEAVTDWERARYFELS